MRFWRYKLLEMAFGLVLFVLSLPVLFLAIGLFGRLIPENVPALAIVVPVLIWLIGMAKLTWKISEKLSKRWSH
ncbi:MAG TPA: hypothetical protein VF440_11605 [Novosphingobium sp.]